jgi:hypothetical protein
MISLTDMKQGKGEQAMKYFVIGSGMTQLKGGRA